MRLVLFAILLSACTGTLQTGPSNPNRPPPPPRGDNRPPPPPPRDDRPRPQPQPDPGERWTQLAEPQFNEDYRDFIAVGAGAGQFRRLRIDVTRGRVHIVQVGIEFADGAKDNTQKVKVGREAGAGESLTVDLEGRAREIKRIVVYVDPAQGRRDRGIYRVYAR
jgi:hypothetical protein